MLSKPKEAGQDPDPKQRFFAPLTRLLDESGVKYPPESPLEVTIMLLSTATDGDPLMMLIAPCVVEPPLVLREEQSYSVLL